MVDEPTRHTPPEDAATADRSASPHEVEWRDEFSRMLSTLDDELVAAVATARQQISAAAETVQARGSEMLAQLHQQRAEQDAQQVALQQRVADVQANIEAVEEEVRLSREDADRESAEVLSAARQRAEDIIADAEARAAEIIVAARARAAAQSSGAPGAGATAGEARNVEGRLRGLSERVGRLLSTPAGAAVAGAGAVGLGAAGLAAASSAASPAALSTAPVAPYEREAVAASVPAPVADDVDGDEDEAEEFDAADAALADDDQPTQMLPALDASPSDEDDEDDTPPPDMGRLWAPAAVEADDDAAPSSGMPVWPSAAADEDDDEAAERPTSINAVPHDEPVFMRRAPDLTTDADEEEDEEPVADEAAATEPEPDAVVAGPTGAVTQTLIFQSVPNFQAALALERSLKAMAEVREVRVADFDERQLTFQVTHELGSQLPRVLLTQRGGELELVEARPERVEFMFRS